MQPTGGNLFTEKMEVNLDMFHPGVEDRISGEVGGTNVIAPQRQRRQRNTKFTEKRSDPE